MGYHAGRLSEFTGLDLPSSCFSPCSLSQEEEQQRFIYSNKLNNSPSGGEGGQLGRNLRRGRDGREMLREGASGCLIGRSPSVSASIFLEGCTSVSYPVSFG